MEGEVSCGNAGQGRLGWRQLYPDAREATSDQGRLLPLDMPQGCLQAHGEQHPGAETKDRRGADGITEAVADIAWPRRAKAHGRFRPRRMRSSRAGSMTDTPWPRCSR
jgi:hypothetical protein